MTDGSQARLTAHFGLTPRRKIYQLQVEHCLRLAELFDRLKKRVGTFVAEAQLLRFGECDVQVLLRHA